LKNWRTWLSAEEQRRADAFQSENHRRDYQLAHAALRWVLGGCLGMTAAQVQFQAGSFGGNGMYGKSAERIKPALALHAGQGLRFNLSHTRHAALIAVAVGLEVGIDIEWERPLDDLSEMARSVMSDQELHRWAAIRLEDQQRAFYRVWTRKEAYLKAIGLGLYRNLQDVTVPVTADFLGDALGSEQNVQDVSADEETNEGPWRVRDVSVDEGYSAAICFPGNQPIHLIIKDLDWCQVHE